MRRMIEGSVKTDSEEEDDENNAKKTTNKPKRKKLNIEEVRVSIRS